MNKGLLIGGVLLAAVALSFPLSNLMPRSNPDQAATLAAIQDPAFKKAAPIFQTKCIDCHTADARIPFYADFSIARDLISADMKLGKERFDLTGKLAENGKAFNELDLARLENVLNNGSMPPFRYTALHWNAGLSTQDVADLRAWITSVRSQKNLALGVAPEFKAEPISPLPQTVSLPAEKVALGDRLFHDKRLSADNTLSCASCHALDKGGTDRARFSTGIRGQLGPINSPTVFNAAYNFKQFWDGRAANLFEQAPGPVHNPLEMGSNWAEVIPKLQQDPAYVAVFNKLYPNGITGDNIADAIATFEESLITPNARFDQYLRGDKTALSAVEVKGYELFKANCVSCHAGAAVGGQSFEKMGRRADYFTDRAIALTDADLGVFNVSKIETDKHYFKVPTLRNIAQTAPYYHDGTVTTLREAVVKMTKYQTDKKFTDTEIDAVVAFLGTLTGEYKGKPVQ